MKLTASTVQNLSAEAEAILRAEIPRADKMFDFEKAIQFYKKVEFKADAKTCGALLYDVFNVAGELCFFVSCFALDARKCGECGAEIYSWLESEARKLGCKYLQFDSPRKGMLRHAQTYGWYVVSVKYGKVL